MISSTAPTNKLAMLSFISAFFTLSSFCVGVVPIPFTAWVCYPAAVLFGVVALFSGALALRQIQVSGEKGRAMAQLGIWTGVLTILAVLCFTAVTILLFYYGADYIWSLLPQFKP